MKTNVSLLLILICSLFCFSCLHDSESRSTLENYIFAKTVSEYLNDGSNVPVYNREIHTELNNTSAKQYLILMYLAGDSNSIQDALLDNMVDVSKGMARSSADITTVALFDGIYITTPNGKYTTTPAGAGASLFNIKGNSKCTSESLVKDFKITENLPDWISSGEVNSGSYITLGNFLSWAEQNFNPDREKETIIIIGSHGLGTYGTTKPLLSSQAAASIDLDSINVNSFCPDLTSGTSYIHTNEIPLALESGGFSSTNKAGMLIYDTCLCGTIEEAYEVRDYAKSIIFSPNESPAKGFPYETVIAKITPSAPLFSIGENMVNSFAKDYQRKNFDSVPVTITFADLTFLDGIDSEISELANFFTANTEYKVILDGTKFSYLKHVRAIHVDNLSYKCTCFYCFYSFDLGYLCDKIQSYAEENNCEELENICTKIKGHLEKIVACSWRGSTSNSGTNSITVPTYTDFNTKTNYYGLSIVGHTADEESRNYNPYARTNFGMNKDTTWKNLLKLLYPEDFK